MIKDTIRTLSAHELALVCGGSSMNTFEDGGITVYGDAPDDDPYWPSNEPDPWDQPDWDNGGGGGGGGGDDTQNEVLLGLAQSFVEIAELYKNGTGISGTIFASLNYAQLSASSAGLTMQWGLNDIEFFRATGGMHVPSAQGSLIGWQNGPVDWSQYDQGGTAEDVMANFLNSLK